MVVTRSQYRGYTRPKAVLEARYVTLSIYTNSHTSIADVRKVMKSAVASANSSAGSIICSHYLLTSRFTVVYHRIII